MKSAHPYTIMFEHITYRVRMHLTICSNNQTNTQSNKVLRDKSHFWTTTKTSCKNVSEKLLFQYLKLQRQIIKY